MTPKEIADKLTPSQVDELRYAEKQAARRVDLDYALSRNEGSAKALVRLGCFASSNAGGWSYYKLTAFGINVIRELNRGQS